MDPPPPTTTTPTPLDSVNSSPHSKATTESFNDSCQLISTSTSTKLRLMCSVNGHIIPRPHDKSLCYVGGDTRIVVVDRHSTLSQLTSCVLKSLVSCQNQSRFILKYQLPSEDLDSLITVNTDEDLENMIEEYDRLNSNDCTRKLSRLRLFLFNESTSSIGSLLENSEDWFLDALNGTNCGELSNSNSNSVNCLLGLNDDVLIGNNLKSCKNQDVQSVPNSPMLDTTSSFGSASSTPKSLPPIKKVKVANDQQHVVGIEEQLAQMVVDGNVNHKLEDGGLKVSEEAVAVSFGQLVGDYSTRILSDDDYRRQLQQQQAQLMASQLYHNRDLASPDSVSSDGSITNPLPRQKPMMYLDPNIQYSSVQSRVSVEQNITDPRFHQMQQRYQDSGYLLPAQFDPRHHQELHQQQPQFINAGTQYIQNLPAGGVPMPSYYPVYFSQQPQHSHHPALEQQYPVYYVPARQTQAYNMPVHTDYNEAVGTMPSGHPQTTPPAAMVSPSAGQYNIVKKATAPILEVPTNLYRTTNAAAASVVQVPTGQSQPQYLDFSQYQQPQSIAPTSATTNSHAYEFTGPTQAHVYNGQPLASPMAAQYQTMTSVSPEAAAQLPLDSIKSQDRTL